MIKRCRRFAPLAALLLASACAAMPKGAAPGPDAVTERGIGGTGLPARQADRGIGGTGVETGIVGAITGFGSIKVDGFEVADDTIRDVLVDGTRRPVSTLAVGQITRIVATGDAASLRAVTVAVEHAVVGPVQSARARDVFVVAGQTVRVPPGTVGKMPAPGRFVAVSGLRDATGTIRATRLDPVEPGDVIVIGRLVAGRSGWRIGQLSLAGSPAGLPGGDRGDGRARVIGRLVGGALRVRSIRAAPLVDATGGPDRTIVQAFVTSLGDNIQIGEDASAARGPSLGPLPPDRAVVLAITRAADGHLTASEIVGAGGGGGHGGGASGAAPDPARAAAANAAPAIDRSPAPGVAAGPAATPGASGGAAAGLGPSAAPNGNAGGAAPGTAGAHPDAAAVGSPPAEHAGGLAAGVEGGGRGGAAAGDAANEAGAGGSGPGGGPRR